MSHVRIGGLDYYCKEAIIAVLDNDVLLRIPLSRFERALTGKEHPVFMGLPAGAADVRLATLTLTRETEDLRYRVAKDSANWVIERFIDGRLDLEEHARRYGTHSAGPRWQPDELLRNRIEQTALGLYPGVRRSRVAVDDNPATAIARTLDVLRGDGSDESKLRRVHDLLTRAAKRSDHES